MIDQSKKKSLIEHIKKQEMQLEREILLSPDLYFDGYGATQCTICANNTTPISTSRFAAHLRKIQDKPDVLAVFVRFCDYSDAEDSEDCWIGSDSVYVITSADLDVVRDWFFDFEISDVWLENDFSKFVGLPKIPDSFHLIAVWWD